MKVAPPGPPPPPASERRKGQAHEQDSFVLFAEGTGLERRWAGKDPKTQTAQTPWRSALGATQPPAGGERASSMGDEDSSPWEGGGKALALLLPA